MIFFPLPYQLYFTPFVLMASFLASRNKGKKEIYQIYYYSDLYTCPDETSQRYCKERLKDKSQNEKYETSYCLSVRKSVI